MNPIRIGLMSDVHLEFDADWRLGLRRRAKKGELKAGDARLEMLFLFDELEAEPGHPALGPDLRRLKMSNVDLVVLAGDIAEGVDAIAYADSVSQYLGVRVVSVAGNHEFYGEHLPKFFDTLRTAAAATDGRVSYLERDRIDIRVGGQSLAILGATLWTDYALYGDAGYAMQSAFSRMRDHKQIRFNSGRFRPRDALDLHLRTRIWLDEEIPVARREADMVIVVTHHPPVPDAIDPDERGLPTTPAYASNLRAQIEKWRPDLWLWGHTHWPMKMNIGRSIALASAPRGYVGVERGAAWFVPEVIKLKRVEP